MTRKYRFLGTMNSELMTVNVQGYVVAANPIVLTSSLVIKFGQSTREYVLLHDEAS